MRWNGDKTFRVGVVRWLSLTTFLLMSFVQSVECLPLGSEADVRVVLQHLARDVSGDGLDGEARQACFREFGNDGCEGVPLERGDSGLVVIFFCSERAKEPIERSLAPEGEGYQQHNRYDDGKFEEPVDPAVRIRTSKGNRLDRRRRPNLHNHVTLPAK